MKITITNVKRGSESVFELMTPEPLYPVNPPVLSFDATTKMDIKALYNTINDVTKFSDRARITIKTGSVVVAALSDARNIFYTFRSPVVSDIDINGKEVSVTYNAFYLLRFLKHARKLSDRVELRLSAKKPIKLSIRHFLGRLEYIVAPIIDC